MGGFDHFDHFAPVYERFIRGGIQAGLQDLLGDLRGLRVLDAAGGTGRIAQSLTGAGAAAVVVTDASPAMLKQAQTKPGLQAAQALAEGLPFTQDHFDRILMVDALHHVIDQAQTAKELFRVLRPGGRLVVEEPDIDTFGVKLIAVAEKLAGMRSRILNARKMAALFALPRAQVRIQKGRGTVWVVVEKQAA